MRGMRMILSVRSGAKKGIQLQSVMRAADGGYGSQGNRIQS
jgi:hypothetical protein